MTSSVPKWAYHPRPYLLHVDTVESQTTNQYIIVQFAKKNEVALYGHFSSKEKKGGIQCLSYWRKRTRGIMITYIHIGYMDLPRRPVLKKKKTKQNNQSRCVITPDPRPVRTDDSTLFFLAALTLEDVSRFGERFTTSSFVVFFLGPVEEEGDHHWKKGEEGRDHVLEFA